MVEINSLSMFVGHTNYKQNTLKKETIEKLLALGININGISSEEEARKLIEQEEKKHSHTADNIEKKSEIKQENLLNRLKSFASKIGLQINKNDNIDCIINKIKAKISELQKDNSNPNLNILKSEFEMLEFEYKNLNHNSVSFLSAMNIMSNTNKFSLGLN